METLRKIYIKNYDLSAAKEFQIKYSTYGSVRQLQIRSMPTNTKTIYFKVSSTSGSSSLLTNAYPFLPGEEYKAHLDVNKTTLYVIASAAATISVMYHTS